MVEIKTASVSRFLSHPDANARLIVCAGKDRGRVKETASIIANNWTKKPADPMNIWVFHASEWKSNPDVILEAALSPSLLGGHSVIRVVDGDKSLQPAMERWISIAHKSPDTIIIIEAGNLPKADALRKIAINSDKAALLFFYSDQDGDIARLIREILEQNHGFRVSSDAIELLQQNLGGDRAVSRSELEKLALYAHGSREITAEHVFAIVSDAAELEFEDLCHAVSLGDLMTLDREFYRLVESNQNVNSLLYIVRAHFAKLTELAFYMEEGMNFSSASSHLRPPLFWKSKPKFEAATRKWSFHSLHWANKRLLDALVEVRTTGRPDVATAQRALFALAMAANS